MLLLKYFFAASFTGNGSSETTLARKEEDEADFVKDEDGGYLDKFDT